jgi:hypothetical protein
METPVDINKPLADSFRIVADTPIIPRAKVQPAYVSLELPVEMAKQLRALCGSLGAYGGEIVTTQRFPHTTTTDGFMHGPFFTASEVHGLAVLIHNSLRRAGV